MERQDGVAAAMHDVRVRKYQVDEPEPEEVERHLIRYAFRIRIDVAKHRTITFNSAIIDAEPEPIAIDPVHPFPHVRNKSLNLGFTFSRDQARKDYVQHRMAENAADLWRWLQDGAHFYVCGDATRMARDVDAALRRIAMAEGKLDETQARDWIVALARQGRYQRDIY